MRHSSRVFILLFFVLVLGNPRIAASPSSSSPIATSSLQNRLVVFEAFMRSTCGHCQAAGPVVDQLAQEYTGQPVVFLEYDVDNAPSSRYGRWWAAFGSGGPASLPMAMVDSGNQIANGYGDFYSIYKAMVEGARIRPIQMEIQAYWWRTGDRIRFYVHVTNSSSGTLSTATIHAIVYEESHIRLTDRFVRQAVSASVGYLEPDRAAMYTLETSDLTDVNWDRLRFVVLVDDRSSGSSGPYDTLQAVYAAESIEGTPMPTPAPAQTTTPTPTISPADYPIHVHLPLIERP